MHIVLMRCSRKFDINGLGNCQDIEEKGLRKRFPDLSIFLREK